MRDPGGCDESPSHALLAAALGGLLCAAVSSGCSSGGSGPASPGSGTTSPPSTVTSASFECDAGVSPSPGVTSSSVGAMTQDQFTAECVALNGVFEIQPECGGQNNCRGMSYDSTTQTLTHHSCRGTNTCAGFACVVCD